MKILLDENIMPKSKMILSQYGHDVIHVLDKFLPGFLNKINRLSWNKEVKNIKDGKFMTEICFYYCVFG